MNARAAFSLLLVIAFLAGCAPQPEPVTPTEEAMPTPEAKATPTPVPEATPTPEAKPTPEPKPTETPEVKPTETPIQVAYAIAETAPGGFADYVPYQVKAQPAVPGYEIDLGAQPGGTDLPDL